MFKNFKSYDLAHPSYPVGTDMTALIRASTTYADALNEVFPDKPINLLVSGSSGAILGGLTMVKLSKKGIINHIKKDGENSHSGESQRIYDSNAYNVILDDFIGMGDTVDRIYKKFTNANPYLEVHGLIVSTGYAECLDWDIDTFISSPDTIRCASKYQEKEALKLALTNS